MGKSGDPWQDGLRAWERLNGWHQDSPSATPGHPDDGEGAVEALADIGRVRHLLDQTELVAVRTARRHGKSWAEIATRLGVTRQSAWERWRDLDDAVSSQPTQTGSGHETVLAVAAGEIALVVVPNVVGMSGDDARRVLHEKGLVGVGSDPDGPSLPSSAWPDGVVTDQSPESGANVPAGSPVRLWMEPGGGSAGVREPRRPKPSPKPAREMRHEPSDAAIS
jgi:PASTA domain